LAALVACRKTDGAAPPIASNVAALSLLPADTVMVVSIDLARVRRAPLVAKLGARGPLPPSLVAALGAFSSKTGVDPWSDLDSVVIAGGLHARWALVARGQRLDGARLAAAAQRALRDDGGDLVVEKRGTLTFWSTHRLPGVEAVLLDEHTLVVAGGGWAQQISARASGGTTATAASNAELAALCQGVSNHPVWGAVLVSTELRDEWLDNLQMQEAAYLDRLAVGLDLDAGLEGKLTATLTEAAQADKAAEDLAQMLVRQRHRSRSNPMFDELLKGVTTYADGSAVHIEASLNESLLLSWAQWLSRYWRIVGAKLSDPGRRLALKMVPAASGKSGSIALGDAGIFTDWDDHRYAIVEVSNLTSHPVVPAVQLVYRRKSGDMVAPGACAVPLGVLLAREKAVCLGNAPTGAVSADYDVDVVNAQTSEQRTTLKVRSAELGPPLGPLQWVAGRVKNETSAVLEHPQVHVAFFDAGGKLVGYGRADFDGKPLLPGAEATFQATSLVMMAGPATTFTISTFALGNKH
jgi:hypothetical protein